MEVNAGTPTTATSGIESETTSDQAVRATVLRPPTLVLMKGPVGGVLPDDRRGETGTGWHSFRNYERAAGRLAMQQAAAQEFGTVADSIIVSTAPSGAPRAWLESVLEVSSPVGPRVSVSHRDGCVAAAADRGRHVGVDLERLTPLTEESARYFLTPGEQQRHVPDRATLWALKEAAWKALECPESTVFTALELHFDDEGALRAVSLEGVRFAAGASVLSPWPGYVLAVVWLEDGAG